MGPLSAVAISFWLALFAGTQLSWWTARPTAIGWVAIIAVALILIDTFWPAVRPHIARRREVQQ